MQIGIDARLPHYQMGGISRYVLQLLPALAALDNVNEYIVFHSRKDATDRVPHQENFMRQDLWTPCHHRYERWLLSLELVARNLDVLHSPDFIPPVKAARRHIITVHDLTFLYYPQFLTEESMGYYAGQIGWAVNHADRVIADSEHTRQDLIKDLDVPAEKVVTVHLAADPQFANIAGNAQAEQIQSTLRRYHLRPGFILFVGTLEPRKNIPTLLEAYAKLRRNTATTAPLIMVGRKGWLYDDVFATIDKLGLRPHVHHLSEVDDRELAHLYLSAALLALPSYYEGFGLSVLEAMHCRCPVLVSNRASLPEVVGQAGVLVEADDVEGWAAAMKRVLADDNLRGQMIASGLRRAQQFSWSRTAAETRRVYEQLA